MFCGQHISTSFSLGGTSAAATAVAAAGLSSSKVHAAESGLTALHRLGCCRRHGGTGWQQRAAYTGCPRRRRAGGVGVAAVSTPERLTVTERAQPAPPPQLDVKVIGFGSRGASAISKLVEHGKVGSAELWCLDVDKPSLEAIPPGITTLLLPKGDSAAAAAGGSGGGDREGKLQLADLQRIVGRAASDAGGRGNINGGTDGAVTFVLAPAATAPGGAATVLQIVQALRAAGHFTVAAVTQPFAFEGHAKQEQAAELIEALQQTAHMVAVMEQDVLMQAFGDAQMTVSQATDIADNALEHSVCCILQAVQAEEILKSSRGALMWHGRDLRHFKRILAPPLQQLLSQPGTAVLGRGLASMPAEAAHQMGAAQALMHLASDAVRAAAESPFLDGALEGASGLLCSINLPATDQPFATGGGGFDVLQAVQTADGQRRAVHLAAQAAAGALGTMSGPLCQEFVVCAEPRPLGERVGDGSLVEVEATLLVLRAPEGGAAAGGGAAAASGITRRPLLQQQQYGVGPAVPLPLRQQPPPQPQRLPSSSWKQLSVLAGGAPAATTGSKAAAPAQQQQQGGASGEQQQPKRSLPNFFGGGSTGRRQDQQQQQAAPQQQQGAGASRAAAASAQQQRQQQQAPQQQAPQQQQQQRVQIQRPDRLQQTAAARSPPLASAPAAASTPVQQRTAAAAPAPAATDEEQPANLTVSEYLINTLTAQSLDLPPAAAQWRQEHRSEAFKERKLIVWEVDELEPWEEEVEEPQGLAALLPGARGKEKRVNIKDRMTSILMQDREDAWEGSLNTDEE